MTFRFPGGDARTSILGATGSGKTTCGLWFLSRQRLDKRPWIVFDLKREPIFDVIGMPPVEEISLSSRIPRQPGLYLLSPLPHEADAIDAFLWRVFNKGNVGVYIDEAALMPDSDALVALMQQGRSKRIPVIACMQRPVGVARQFFSEASFFCVYRMADKRDYKVVEGFVPGDLSAPLPRHHWRWYDVAENQLLHMAPVPSPQIVAEEMRTRAPKADAWHPWSWSGRPTTRPSLRLVG